MSSLPLAFFSLKARLVPVNTLWVLSGHHSCGELVWLAGETD